MASLEEGFPHMLDLSKIAVFGHSLGGATAAVAMLTDSRIKAGLDFDGSIYGPVINQGLSNPFILLSTNASRSEGSLASWDPFYSNLRSTKVDLDIANTTHLSFLDVPFLLTVYPLPENLKPAIESGFGKINGRQMQIIVDSVLTTFFDAVFRGWMAPLCFLARRFRELSVVRESLPHSYCVDG